MSKPMMQHEVMFEPEDEKQLDAMIKILGKFDFDKIRPIPKTLITNDKLNNCYAESGRVLWVDQLIVGFPAHYHWDTYSNEKFLINMIVPMDNLNMGQIQRKYDRKVALAREQIRKLPVIGNEDALHKYGYPSENTSYLFRPDTEQPKCQGDAILLGKYSFENLICYGVFSSKNWIKRNWGTDKPLKVQITSCEAGIIYKFNTIDNDTIFPLLRYIVKVFDVEMIKHKITYSYGTGSVPSVEYVKPFDSNFFTEM